MTGLPLANVILKRIISTDQGTVGFFIAPDFSCYSMEPPWRDNQPNRSCIPPGVYHCIWHRSPRYGWVYLVTDVSGRSHILTHSGNLGGDELMGYWTHTNGCILLGAKLGRLPTGAGKQRAVLTSRPTVRRFFESMNQQPFSLEVIG